MKRKKSIVYLKRNQLEPHPQNPRKNLGDLEELRESIRQNGIMQNLTVIPTDDSFERFRILIGHRRFAASDGIIDELPCVIAEDLTDREQVGIMLCENLQRNDLTYYEQAQGFQMMMDLGDTVDQISEKTGFSSTTVRHRLEIAKLSKKLIDEVEEETSWQIGINDYIELEKIKDLKNRAEILEDSSSSDDLKHNVDRYLRDQKEDANKAKLVELLTELGGKETHDGMSYSEKYVLFELGEKKSKWLYFYDDIDFEKLRSNIEERMSKTKNPLYYQLSYSTIIIGYKKKETNKEKKKTKAELEAEKRKKNELALRDARKQICAEFAKTILDIDPDRFSTLEKEKRLIPMITDLWKLMERAEVSFYSYTLKLEQSLCKSEFKPLIDKYEDLHIVQKMMIRILVSLSDRHGRDFCDWQNKPNRKNLKLFDDYYDVLYGMGSRLSNDFELIIEGSSNLYEPEDGEE